MRDLPPFDELVAFEAVARHLSFTRAAVELCLTQSAVSHRVRRLEEHYGTPLLRRLNPGLSLTETGAALLPELAVTLDTLARLGRRGKRRLRFAAGNALSTWWLAGRLPDFIARRPDITIDLVPVHADAALQPEVDVRLLWLAPEEEAAGEVRVPLCHENVFPVCSPRLLPGGRPLSNLSEFASLTLLHKTITVPGEWSWSVWLERLGLDPQAARGGAQLRFADVSLVLSAAIDGAGVALGRSLLVHDALRDGRLVVPVMGVKPMLSRKRHVACWRREQADHPDILALVSWLQSEAQASVAGTCDRAPASVAE